MYFDLEAKIEHCNKQMIRHRQCFTDEEREERFEEIKNYYDTMGIPDFLASLEFETEQAAKTALELVTLFTQYRLSKDMSRIVENPDIPVSTLSALSTMAGRVMWAEAVFMLFLLADIG